MYLLKNTIIFLLLFCVLVDQIFAWETEFKTKDGGTYKGEVKWWRKTIPHGTGTLTYASGDTYSGAWVDGQKSGKGREYFLVAKDGCTFYEGEFKNSVRDGKGNMYYEDGSHEQQYWSKGKRA